MINYNFLHAFCDIAHVGFLDLLNLRGSRNDIPALSSTGEARKSPPANPFGPDPERFMQIKA
jgi:hypothetical protein